MSEKCRACHSPLATENLLEYRNMPKSAQFFPTAENVHEEKGVTIILKECPFCGLVQAIGNPVPYYRDVIRASGVSEEMKNFRRNQFRQWVEKYSLNGKKVIEIGSGRGEYLSLMTETEALAWGFEHDENAVNDASAIGLHMLKGFVDNEETDIQNAPYDGFFCLNYLEHIPEPDKFLRGIRRNLTENAVGLVEVPSFQMMIEKSLYSEFIQDHLSYFTEVSLKNLLSNNGFEVLSVHEIWYGYILSAEIRKRPHINVQGMIDKRKLLKEKVQDYLSSCRARNMKVAGWGAGHQALANLSLLDMAGGISCVIDSAVFKQNHMTPATHLPIVGPSVLDEGVINAVIIMAAGYSDEINVLLQREYPNIEVSVLSDEFIVL